MANMMPSVRKDTPSVKPTRAQPLVFRTVFRWSSGSSNSQQQMHILVYRVSGHQIREKKINDVRSNSAEGAAKEYKSRKRCETKNSGRLVRNPVKNDLQRIDNSIATIHENWRLYMHDWLNGLCFHVIRSENENDNKCS